MKQPFDFLKDTNTIPVPNDYPTFNRDKKNGQAAM